MLSCLPLKVWVATNSLAYPSLLSRRSQATIIPAPASRAPCTTLRPTPAQQITSTEAPAYTRAHEVTAPTPVGTQQPTRAACGHGISRSEEHTSELQSRRDL